MIMNDLSLKYLEMNSGKFELVSFSKLHKNLICHAIFY